MLVMFLMPFIGRWNLGHRFNVVYIFSLLLGAGLLTYMAFNEDRSDPKYQQAVADAETKSKRIVELVRGPTQVGPFGARAMLQNDPKTHGPEVFARNCSACHRFDGHDGTGKVLAEEATASDLGNFGMREYIRGFIADPAGPKFFGATVRGAFNGEEIGERFTEGEMVEWSVDNVPEMQKREIDGVVEFLLAQSKRTDIPSPDPELVEIGQEFFVNGSENAQACSDCHAIRVNGEELAEGAMDDRIVRLEGTQMTERGR